MTNPTAKASSVLSSWLVENVFRPQVDEVLSTLRHPSRSATWYTEHLNNNGYASAEARLKDWVRDNQLHEVSRGIVDVARGMYVLADESEYSNRRPTYVRLAPEYTSMPNPNYFGVTLHARTVVAFNPELPHCGCRSPHGADLFAPGGTFGLRAVVLTVDRVSPEDSQLNLVLSTHAARNDPHDFAVVSFNPEGFTRTGYMTSRLLADGPLRAALGLVQPGEAWTTEFVHSSDPDALLGAGNTALLRSNLTNLGTYFMEVAERLSSRHQH